MKLSVKKLYSLIPVPLKDLQNSLRIKDRLLLAGKRSREKKAVAKVRAKIQQNQKVNVVFMAMSVSFWKYDNLFELMQKSSHFKPVVLLTKRPQDTLEIQQMHHDKMTKYFGEKGFPVIETLQGTAPDILFYAQPYKNSITEELRAYNFLDKLICYVPYAFFISNYKWAYDAQVHNLAWKLFYPSELHKKNAEQISFIRGKNVEVVGYPLADKFATPAASDPWKIKDPKIKRIVWGVHHSVLSDDLADCGTFLAHAESMLDRARKNPEFQFAFKPHPHLKEHLYRHPDWGKARTDTYFAAWNVAPNTFLFDNDYIDLFKTSDALIHDCGSFTVEYLYVDKPVLYIGNQRDDILCNFGKASMEANYTQSDFSIDEFLQMVAGKAGADTKRDVRQKFIKEQLNPPNGISFAQNIMNILEKAFG